MVLDLTNKRFGNLVATKRTKRVKGRGFYWRCQCDCGNEAEYPAKDLNYGSYKSCGCQRDANQFKPKHGFSRGTKLQRQFHKAWHSAIMRCTITTHKNWDGYGGRGIKVVKRWMKFENFRDDMWGAFIRHVENFGADNTSLDRINNDGNYSPKNCRWATRSQQQRNKRPPI